MKKILFACMACLVVCNLWADNIELNNDDNGNNNSTGRTEIPITVDSNGDEVTVTSSDHVGITDVVIRNTANEVICHRVMNLCPGSVENIVLTEQQSQEKYLSTIIKQYLLWLQKWNSLWHGYLPYAFQTPLSEHRK